MTPRSQILMSNTKGDCFRACVASIFDLPIRRVPNFVTRPNWIEAVNDWLRGRGLFMAVTLPPQRPAGYSVASVPSRNGKWRHAVVALDGKVIHDPGPNRPKTNRNRERYVTAYFSFVAPGQEVMLT